VDIAYYEEWEQNTEFWCLIPWH